MSRSRKKNVIYKDSFDTRQYWKNIRAVWKRITYSFDWKESYETSFIESREEEPLEDKDYLKILQQGKELIYPNKRSIINDYDIIDHRWVISKEDKEMYNKIKRK